MKERRSFMSLFQIYWKALLYLKQDKKSVLFICGSNLIISAFTIAQPVIFGRVIDAISERRDIIPILGLWSFLGFISIIAVGLVSRGADRLAHRRKGQVLSDSYERILHMPLVWHQKYSSSNLIHALSRSTESLFVIWLEFMRTHLSTALSLILLVPTAISLDLRMSFVLFCLGLAYVVITSLVMHKTRYGQKKVEKHHHNVFAHISDTISNVPILQSYDRVRIESEFLRNHIRKLLVEQNPVLDWWAIANVLNRLSATISMMIVLIIGAYLVFYQNLAIGSLVAFTGFATLLIGQLDQISGIVAQIFDARAKLEEFYSIELACQQQREEGLSQEAVDLQEVKGSITFDKVCFQFPNHTKKAIEDLSFTIEPGKIVAIVGPAGSGKTTLINLLQRVYIPNAGKILIDGTNIAHISLRSLRRSIATVFQHTGLLHRSIEENIRIGNEYASLPEIMKASKIAMAHDFIFARDLGYKDDVGEQGARLSGGERQRIAIARAILKKSPILVLDEATSALDVQTEADIKDAMRYLKGKCTIFMIAHRLTTIQDADLVLFIQKGRLVEKGTFSELSQGKGPFSRFLQLTKIPLKEARSSPQKKRSQTS